MWKRAVDRQVEHTLQDDVSHREPQRNRTIATQALYSAVLSSLRPLLRVGLSAALDPISSELMASSPNWLDINHVQNR
jgi:hypothetical protein